VPSGIWLPPQIRLGSWDYAPSVVSFPPTTA